MTGQSRLSVFIHTDEEPSSSVEPVDQGHAPGFNRIRGPKWMKFCDVSSLYNLTQGSIDKVIMPVGKSCECAMVHVN